MDGWGVWRVRCEKKLARVIGCCASNLRAVIGCRGQNLHMKEADYRGGKQRQQPSLVHVCDTSAVEERKKEKPALAFSNTEGDYIGK